MYLCVCVCVCMCSVGFISYERKFVFVFCPMSRIIGCMQYCALHYSQCVVLCRPVSLCFALFCSCGIHCDWNIQCYGYGCIILLFAGCCVACARINFMNEFHYLHVLFFCFIWCVTISIQVAKRVIYSWFNWISSLNSVEFISMNNISDVTGTMIDGL